MSSDDGDVGGSGGGGSGHHHHSKPQHSTNNETNNNSHSGGGGGGGRNLLSYQVDHRDHNHNHQIMPASTTSLINQVPRLQMAAAVQQSLHDFSASLPFPVTYSASSSPSLFLYPDDVVFEALSTSGGGGSDHNKDDPNPPRPNNPDNKPIIVGGGGGRPSSQSVDVKKESKMNNNYGHHRQQQQEHENNKSRSPSSSPSDDGASSSASSSRNDREGRGPANDSSSSGPSPSPMVVSVSSFSASDGRSENERTARRERLTGGGGGAGNRTDQTMSGIPGMIGVNHHNQQQQLLRYTSNGGDSLLGTSSVGYGDGEMLREGGFHGLLSSGDDTRGGSASSGRGNGSNPTFELFDGDGVQDAYSAATVADGGDELRLSPNAFNLNDGSNGAAATESGVVVKGVDEVDQSIDSNKLSVPTMMTANSARKPKIKSRPNKTSSPNRSGSQSCPVCSKIFSNSSALAKHKLTHSDERKYVCQLCTKAFKRQDHLNGHLLTHMNKKPYECKVEGCGKSYCDARSLRRHTENHHANTSAAAAAAVVAATKAKVNAIRVGGGGNNSNNVHHHPQFGGGGSDDVKVTDALNGYMTSNRICYAPPPPPNPQQQQQHHHPSSDAPPSNPTTITSNVLQSVLTAPPMNAFHRSPSPSSTNNNTTTTTSSSSSSAATQLQLLAFQQQQEPPSRNAATSLPLPAHGTSLLSWQLQQPRANSRMFYANGSQGSLPPPPQQQPSHVRSTREIVEDYLSQQSTSATNSSGSAIATSVLAQHLRMGIPPPPPPSQSHSGSLLQESLTSRLSSPQSQHVTSGLLQGGGSVLQVGTNSMQQGILDQLREQWAQQPQTASFVLSNNNNNGSVPVIAAPPQPVVVVKQVECSICQRKFKNTPALNGHMRLHGGYVKKDNNNDITKRVEKKSDHGSHHSSSNHPPLQTASINIRALIEEKIIQRRIVNPLVTTTLLQSPPNPNPNPPPPPPTSLLSVVTSIGGQDLNMTGNHLSSVVNVVCNSSPRPPSDEFMHFNPECISDPLPIHTHHHQQQQQQQQIHDHQNMVQMHHPSSSSSIHHHQQEEDPNPYHHHHQQQQQLQSQTTDDLCPPLSPPSPVTDSPYANDPMDTEDEAHSDMQRQIEIIKQGLMSNQHISEKFRRHSDSDHFLAPRLLLYDDGGFSAGALADFFQRRAVVGKRMQRTGSDPGEFVFGQMSDGLLPDDVVVAMDELRASESVAGDGDLDDDGLQVDVVLPSSDMMDFEVGAAVDDDNLASTLSLQTLDRTCETSLLATALTANHHTMSMEAINMHSSPRYSPTVGNCGESSAFAPYGDIQEQMSLSVHPTNKIKQEEDDDVFLSPSSIPTSPIRGKKKHRPEPLFIPPQVNTCGFQSRLRSPRLWDPVTGGKACSPPPYTPPPMLSPVRCGSGLFWHVRNNSGSMTPKSAPLTPGRQMSLASVCGFQTEVQTPVLLEAEEEEIGEAPETDILPHVNIGSQFQARLPICRPFDRKYDRKSADLVWDPFCVESISEKEVDMYLQFACCAAVPGGGRNKEYALHVLQMASGNIQEAMLQLMDPTPKLRKSHPLLKYPYSESDKWSTEEIESYQQALMNFDKDFFNISLEMKTKSVKDCIQFYYLWKKMCPDDYKKLRITRRRRETDGLLYGLRSTKEEDSDNTPKSDDPAAVASPRRQNDVGSERFVCDHPDCFASFASRQALNGHIRIHGGNTSVRGTGGNRSRSPANDDASRYSPANNNNNLPPNASSSSTQFADLLLDEFPCKICGKVFNKVKSRSAHMKSHRPIDPDRYK